MTTFGDIKDFIARFADGGVCPDSDRCKDAVSEAIERLLGKPALAEKLAIRSMRITAWGNTVTMPRIVNRVLKVRYDNRPAYAWTKWYEFMANGPGFTGEDSLGIQDLVDRGEVPTQYDIPSHQSGYHLLVLTDNKEDEGTELRIRGLDETEREVRTDGMGELVPIAGGYDDESVGIYTTALFSSIINVTKPRTNGYVYLSTWNPETGERFHLATYHPDETAPSYRRYAFKGWNFNDEAEPCSHDVYALVKVRAMPITRDEDILLVDNRSALKAMVQAIRYYDAGDAKSGAAYEGIAERILADDTEDYSFEPSEGLDVQTDTWMGGDIPNIR